MLFLQELKSAFYPHLQTLTNRAGDNNTETEVVNELAEHLKIPSLTLSHRCREELEDSLEAPGVFL